MDWHMHEDGSMHIPGKLVSSIAGRRTEVDSYLGQLRIRCRVPLDADSVDVHVGDCADFEPSTATWVGRIRGPVGVVYASAEYDADRYVKTVQHSKAVRARALRPVDLGDVA